MPRIDLETKENLSGSRRIAAGAVPMAGLERPCEHPERDRGAR